MFCLTAVAVGSGLEVDVGRTGRLEPGIGTGHAVAAVVGQACQGRRMLGKGYIWVMPRGIAGAVLAAARPC